MTVPTAIESAEDWVMRIELGNRTSLSAFYIGREYEKKF
jgi:hypothetical protein